MEFKIYQQVEQMSLEEQENVLAQAAIIVAGNFVGPAADVFLSALRALAEIQNPHIAGEQGRRLTANALKSWMAHLRMLAGVCTALEHPYNQLLEQLEESDG